MFLEARVNRAARQAEEELYKVEKELEFQEQIDALQKQREEAEKELKDIVELWDLFLSDFTADDLAIPGEVEGTVSADEFFDDVFAGTAPTPSALLGESPAAPYPVKPDSEIVDETWSEIFEGNLADEGDSTLAAVEETVAPTATSNLQNAYDKYQETGLYTKAFYADQIFRFGNDIVATVLSKEKIDRAKELSKQIPSFVGKIDNINKQIQELQESTARSRARAERKAENEQRDINRAVAKTKKKRIKRSQQRSGWHPIRKKSAKAKSRTKTKRQQIL